MKIKWLLNIAICLGLLSGYGVNRWINQQERSLFMTPVCSFETNEKELVLSFDDGPGPATPALLELLNKKNVKALFFVLGRQIEAHPATAKSIADNGHLVSNHSYKHKRMILRTFNYIEEDLLKTDQLIASISPKTNNLYRPPYGQGLFNLPRVLSKHKKVLYNWSINANAQYEQPYSKERIVSQTLEQLHDGGIILLHDGWEYMPPELLVAIVDEIITKARDLGYKFVLPKV